ncbi:hypothetical protein [Aliikangiella coralliicola]|uniref:Uncharacterized protein n=1 Tax=Aliikangiella coralliicola TaxID=2592383 RepID=A0A545UDW0_9GAMM|nr:hypothetical protein [Aliikangiella coralliicola]TQV87636.1 hypothetical protein FLL46_12265 [Aliikangiella coralliicola]
MLIPRYWKRVFRTVENIKFHKDSGNWSDEGKADIYAWGYSDSSEADALERANQRVEEIAKALSSDFDSGFYYPMAVIREEILEELAYEGVRKAIVSRNRYYSQVLNTEEMMFIDIDVPTWAMKPAGFFQRLFGQAKKIDEKNKKEKQDRFDSALKKVEEYASGDSNAGFLVYRTYAGFRLIATHKTFEADSEETRQLFDVLGADALYQQLCKVQKCFRARLTPKFWRLEQRPEFHPSLKFRITRSMLLTWSGEDKERLKEYDDWVAQYDKSHDSYATCHFIKHIGNNVVSEELKSLIEFHDEKTQAHSELPLA